MDGQCIKWNRTDYTRSEQSHPGRRSAHPRSDLREVIPDRPFGTQTEVPGWRILSMNFFALSGRKNPILGDPTSLPSRYTPRVAYIINIFFLPFYPPGNALRESPLNTPLGWRILSIYFFLPFYPLGNTLQIHPLGWRILSIGFFPILRNKKRTAPDRSEADFFIWFPTSDTPSV